MMSKLKLIEVIEIPAEYEPLYKALIDCKVDHGIILEAVYRLAHPPLSLWLDTAQSEDDLVKSVIPFDRKNAYDCAAYMLRIDEGKPDPDITWKALTLAERKRAKRLWDFAIYDPSRITPLGRPIKGNGALVLYCIRVIEETCGRKFGFSRPKDGGSVDGPRWRALMAALAVVEQHFSRIYPHALRQQISPVSVEEIVVTTRLKKGKKETPFLKWSRYLGLGLQSSDIADHPSAFRYCIFRARTLELPPESKIPSRTFSNFD